MMNTTPVDPALRDETESGECRTCGRNFLWVSEALAHIAARPCRTPWSLRDVAHLEQAQWALQRNNFRHVSNDDEDWAYAYLTHVPMIYGGYVL
jgi:hypothetical protein